MGIFGPNIEKLRAQKDVDGLVKVLDKGQTKHRIAAAKALGEMRASQALASLVRSLGLVGEQSKDELAPAAMEAIVLIGDTDELLRLLTVEEREIRSGAAVALARLGCQQAVEPLTSILSNGREDLSLRQIAVYSLRQLGNVPGLQTIVGYFVDSIRSFGMKGFSMNGLIPTPGAIDILLERGVFAIEIAEIMAFGQAALEPLDNALENETNDAARMILEKVIQKVRAKNSS